jgi:hypothetical protein
MNKRCSACRLTHHPGSLTCIRCGGPLSERENISSNTGFNKSVIVKRISVCLMVVVATLFGFYTSMVISADGLDPLQSEKVQAAIEVLEEKGFTDEVFLLKRIAVFRSTDNWLNASIEKENAYAATNFPFEIVTIYPDFFTYTTDEVERAAILLHEAKHLEGKDEKEAYEFVWKNRDRLGWTSGRYAGSIIWRETRKLTKEHSPLLFVCEFGEFADCTEPPKSVVPSP